MSYKKVGGIHFVKLGRFGFNFYVSKPSKRVEPSWFERFTMSKYEQYVWEFGE